MGWDAIPHGDLLRRAEAASFDVFITGDQGILYRKNHTGRRIPIILITSIYWPAVESKSALILDAIHGAVPGSFSTVIIDRALS
jgi:hypothetical protein